jgi:hypothetical protein
MLLEMSPVNSACHQASSQLVVCADPLEIIDMILSILDLEMTSTSEVAVSTGLPLPNTDEEDTNSDSVYTISTTTSSEQPVATVWQTSLTQSELLVPTFAPTIPELPRPSLPGVSNGTSDDESTDADDSNLDVFPESAPNVPTKDSDSDELIQPDLDDKTGNKEINSENAGNRNLPLEYNGRILARQNGGRKETPEEILKGPLDDEKPDPSQVPSQSAGPDSNVYREPSQEELIPTPVPALTGEIEENDDEESQTLPSPTATPIPVIEDLPGLFKTWSPQNPNNQFPHQKEDSSNVL